MNRLVTLLFCWTGISGYIIASPISGNKAIGPGGDYVSLTAAFSAINTNGLGGAVILSIQAGYLSTAETFPLNPPLTATYFNTITVRPAVNGLTITSSNNGATFNLNGVKYFILDGRVNGIGNVPGLTVNNTAVSQGCCLKFSNDACNNIIRYCKLKGVNSSVSSGGVVIFSNTNASTGNDNNLIEYCNISDGNSTPANGIISLGTSGKDNSGNIVSHCNIYNFYTTGSQCNGVYFPGSSYNSNWTIDNNNFYQTNARTVNGNFYAISTESTSTGDISIINNCIGGQLPACEGDLMVLTGSVVFRGLRITVSQSSQAIITGNFIRNIAIMTSSQSQVISGISLVSGSFLCANNTIKEISYSNATNAASFSAIIAGSGSPVNIDISSNRISYIDLSGNGNCSLKAINIVVPILSNPAANSIVIKDNIINDLRVNNVMNANVSVNGIFYDGPPNGLNQLANNKIYSLSINNGSALAYVYGINIQNSNTNGSLRVYNNMIILGVDSSGVFLNQSVNVYGILKANGNAAVYYNSIYIGGNNNGNNTIATSAYRRLSSSFDTLINNILVNKRLNEAANNNGKHYACFLGNAINLISDHNVYYNHGLEGGLATCDNGVSSILSISALQQANPGNNQHSIKMDPQFTIIIGDNVGNDLHLQASKNCFIGDIGIAIPGLTLDIDSSLRNSNHPDPGADEFESVYPQPPTATVYQQFCETDSIPDFFASGLGIIKWYTDSLLLNFLQYGNSLHPINLSAGSHNYYITDSISGCESHPITVVLQIDSIGSGGRIAPVTGICLGQSPGILTLLDYTGNIERWQYSVFPFSAWVDIIDTAANFEPGFLYESKQFRAVVRNGVCGEQFSEAILISVYQPQVNYVSNDTEICLNEPAISLSGGLPPGGTYSGAGVSNGQFFAIEAGVGLHPITYSYRDAHSCFAYDTLILQVHDLPSPVITGIPDEICLNHDPLNLGTGYPEGGYFMGEGVFDAVFYPMLAGPGEHQLSYFFTDNNNCSNSIVSNIKVNALPSIYILSGNGTYCKENQGVSLLLSGSDEGVNYSLYKNDSILGSSKEGTGNALIWEENTFGTYSVIAVDSNGCTVEMAGNVLVTENMDPEKFMVIGSGTYCKGKPGKSVILSSSQSGVSYQLFKNGFPDGAALNGTGNNLVWNSKTTGIYTILAVIEATNCSVLMPDSAVIMEDPDFTVSIIPDPAYVAVGNPLELQTIASGGNPPYFLPQWIGEKNELLSNLTDSNTLFLSDQAGDYSYIFTLADSHYCVALDNITVHVTSEVMPPDFTGGIRCGNGSLQMNALPGIGGSSVQFSLDSSTLVAEDSIAPYVYNTPEIEVGEVLQVFARTINPLTGIYSSWVSAFARSVISAEGGSLTGDAVICLNDSTPEIQLSGQLGDILLWQKRQEGDDWISIPETNTKYREIPSSDGTWQYRAVIEIEGCSLVYSNTVTIEVNLPAIGGVLSGSATNICFGEYSGNITLNAYNGQISYWRKRLNNGPWIIIPDTNNFLSDLPASAGTWQYQAGIYKAGCGIVYSSIHEIHVMPPTVAGIVIGEGNVCSGNMSPIMTLSNYSGQILKWQKRLGNYAWTDIQYYSPQFSEIMTQPGSWNYRAVIQNAFCQPEYSSVATIVVLPLAVGGNVSGSTTICFGNSGVNLHLTGYSGTILKWQRKLENNNWTDINHQLAWYTAMPGTVGNWYYRAVINSGSCGYAYSAPAHIIVNSQTLGGMVTGSCTICVGSSIGNLHLINHNGNVVRWQKKPENGDWTDIANISNSFSEINYSPGIWFYRAVVKNGACNAEYSEPAIVTVNAYSIGGNIIGGGAVCFPAAIPLLHLNNYFGEVLNWQKRCNSGPWQNIADTAKDYIEIPDQPGLWEYRALIKNGVCNISVSNSATVNVFSKPQAFELAGPSVFCEGEPGVSISLSGSQIGVAYQLFKNGISFGLPLQGTGLGLSWNGLVAGNYNAIAINSLSFCTNEMIGTIQLIQMPLPLVFNISAEGYDCNGEGRGVITLDSSQFGIAYQLIRNGQVIADPQFGNGQNIQWHGLSAGMYSIIAIDPGSFCEMSMNGIAQILEIPGPLQFGITGDSLFCSNDSVLIGISGSQTGVQYQLMHDGEFMENALIDGNGNPCYFGYIHEAGNYSVMSVDLQTACSNQWNQSLEISSLSSPEVFAGEDIYCFYGAEVTLPGYISGGDIPFTFYWTPPAGLSSDTVLTPHVMAVDTILYTLIASNLNGCTASDQVLINPVLPPLQSAVKGWVNYANIVRTPLSGIPVYIKNLAGAVILQTITNDTGYFQFPAFPDGQYFLTASSNEAVGGINSTDALLALRSYVQISVLHGIYHQSADVDASGFVNAVDALSIQRFFIGLIQNFPAGSWVFEKKSLNLQGTIGTVKILGLCTGDVNGSYLPPN